VNELTGFVVAWCAYVVVIAVRGAIAVGGWMTRAGRWLADEDDEIDEDYDAVMDRIGEGM
jgi:hypothetical protein